MAYTTIKTGSRGSDVSELQSTLNNLGYGLSVDGIFGSKTAAAVRDYQANNGLSVDGIVGTNTWNSLKSGSSSNTSTAAAATTTSTSSTPDYSAYKYDASKDEAYQKAMSALEQAQSSKPTYTDSYGDQVQQIYDKIMNREKFSYDLNSDMLYQQMKDQYTNLGQQAMQDTMGQAAGLTGGYSSSYAQSVGQQQYDAYLQQLNDNIPELYQMAASRYDQEGEDLLNQYNMSTDAQDREYNRYQDALSDYWTNLNYLTGRADTAYENGSSNWYNSYNIGLQQDELNYSKQQDAYSNLTSLIGSTGYSPTDSELSAAGMSRAQANALKSAYDQQIAAAAAASSSSGSSGGSSKKAAVKVGDTGGTGGTGKVVVTGGTDDTNTKTGGQSSAYLNVRSSAYKMYQTTKFAPGAATNVSNYLATQVNNKKITRAEATQIMSYIGVK